jgi:acetate kinase
VARRPAANLNGVGRTVSNLVLVLNPGSSSIKYRLIDTDTDTGVEVCVGLVERIGEAASHIEHSYQSMRTVRDQPIPDHRRAMEEVMALLATVGPNLTESSVAAVGYRVVMGGSDIDGPVMLTDEVLATIERLAPLAPLHNPPSLATIHAGRELLPRVPHVGVFDTAFFHDLPVAAATYAIDHHVAEKYAVRRYGFHGISHQYVAAEAADMMGRDLAELRQIVLHLGNGASASAVANGKPVDTSMGLTPLEGLVMGTRSGDIDPAVVFHLYRNAGMSIDEVEQLLNERSGMKGLTGARDMREVHRLVAKGDQRARLALDIYVRRLKKYIGAYTAVMGGLDALTFTAGVGENDPIVRAATAEGLAPLGIEIDPERNAISPAGPRTISPEGANVSVLVVPTDEELAIARQVTSII